MKRGNSLKVLSIRGVELRLHVSLVALMAYVVAVSAMQFPSVVQQSGLDASAISGSPWLWGLIFALGLLVSVALHEYGHVFMAQSLGARVRGVTLMMLGGVSEMESVPEVKYAEFKLSVVGPLVSLALAASLSWVGRHTSQPELSFFSYWLGNANFVLAIFNLLPAFPLDGGRALRSLLAARQGQIRATQTAVVISKGFAWMLGIFGLLGFNVLLVLIAFFIHSAAQSELFVLVTRRILKGLRVSDFVTPVDPLDEKSTLSTAASKMLMSRQGVLPVETASGDPGLISLATLRQLPRGTWPTTRIREVMEKPARTLSMGDPIHPIMNELAATPSHALPVRGPEGNLMGVVSYDHLAEVLQFKALEQSTDATEDDIDRAA